MAVEYKTLYATLPSGTNKYTFTDNLISDVSKLTIMTDDDDVYPVDAEIINTHSVAIEISSHANTVTVALIINNIEQFDPEQGGGASSLSSLNDVNLSGLQGGNLLMYNNVMQKWVNANIDSSVVGDSVFGNVRQGLSELDEEVGNLQRDKQNKLTAGSNITIVDDVISATGGSGGTTNYSDLTNKPKINNVELNGNKSLSDLGINIPSVPDWALQPNKPTYTADEVGALPDTTSIPSVIDSLESTSTTDALSANQGSVLMQDLNNYEQTTDEEIGGIKSSLTKLGTYSYDEVVIGTFLDKPLYRRIVVETQTRQASATNTWVDCQSVNIPIKYLTNVILTYNTGDGTIMLPKYFTFRYDVAGGKLIGLNTRGSGAQIPAGSLYILEYTKTTD